jgi:hypothetical protein
VPEAPLKDPGSGLAPAGDGWFVVNVRDAQWMTAENRENKPPGSDCRFESREFPFPQVGIKIRVLEPGQPNGLYHSENQQEDFLVLSGECRLHVEVRSGSRGRGTSSTVRPVPTTSSWAQATDPA